MEESKLHFLGFLLASAAFKHINASSFDMGGLMSGLAIPVTLSLEDSFLLGCFFYLFTQPCNVRINNLTKV